jgi:UDP-N-acetylmuramate: L-alanyl-gamma-D-glutamyl-meso-diaminopimelate ligase
MAAAIRAQGRGAETPVGVDAIVARVVAIAEPGDTVVAMSNGAFGQVHEKVLAGLAVGAMESRT